MSGSCHLDRASNVKIGIEYQIFVIVIFFEYGWILQFGPNSRYYKVALTQKRSFLVIWFSCRPGWKNQNKCSTLNLSINALSKWHELDIRKISEKYENTKRVGAPEFGAKRTRACNFLTCSRHRNLQNIGILQIFCYDFFAW